jgi:5-methyltetrahydropteroyltriglutamate--homocysteine methyltransferase
LEFKAYAPGIYPRSDDLIQATRDLDRRRTSPEAVDQQFDRDLENLVALQEEAGLDLLSDGMLRWQDLFRPLVEATVGAEAGPLTRFLDTNTFYRAPVVEREPRLREPLPAPELPGGRWLATLPAPSAFARAAHGAVSAQGVAANVLAPQVEAYAGTGCALVVLSDPFLAGTEAAGEAISALKELPDAVPYVLQLPFGDAGPLLEALAEAPVSGVGLDFYATGLDAVPDGYPKEIVAGVIDSRSSLVEDPSELAAFAEQLQQRNPAGISLSLNGDLQFVSEPIAREKIARLGRAKTTKAEVAA